MIHARKDYNRIQDPAQSDPSLLATGSTPIGEDEPVMLFRAKDKHFIAVMKAYLKMVMDDPDMSNEQWKLFVEKIGDHIGRVSEWQRANGCKTPDLPTEALP